MDSFKKHVMAEDEYRHIKQHLRKAGKNNPVSYTDNDGKTKKTGRYGGLMNRGGRSYAKVHHDDHMAMVPLPQVHHKKQGQ